MSRNTRRFLEPPIACQLGQLEYNPRHYGEEEAEAAHRQEAPKAALARRPVPQQWKVTEGRCDAGRDSAAARWARHDAGSGVARADRAYAKGRRVPEV